MDVRGPGRAALTASGLLLLLYLAAVLLQRGNRRRPSRLKRLRLGGLLPTLPDRLTSARQQKLPHDEFLELLLQDEIDRRDSHGLTLRLAAAGFDEAATFEQIVWDSPVSFDRARVRELFSLRWLQQQENIVFCGHVGVGKSFLACALGHSACRAGYRVRCVPV